MKFQVLAVVTAIGLILGTLSPLNLSQRVMACAAIGAVGGCLAAARRSKRVVVVVRTGASLSVLAVVIAMALEPMAAYDPRWSYAAICASGLAGLGGIDSVDWVLDLFRRFLTRKARKYVDEQAPGDESAGSGS